MLSKFNNHKKLVIIVGNAISERSLINKKNDIYYINSLTKNMNFNFIKRYKNHYNRTYLEIF